MKRIVILGAGFGGVGDKISSSPTAKIVRDGQVVATVGPGEMFGETALICHYLRNAMVRAQTELDLVAVNRESFHELLRHPGFGGSIETLMKTRINRTVDLCHEVAETVTSMPEM
jgi:CRP-like cAMP-binding protein